MCYDDPYGGPDPPTNGEMIGAVVWIICVVLSCVLLPLLIEVLG